MNKGFRFKSADKQGIVLNKGNLWIIFDIPIWTKEGVLWCINMQWFDPKTENEVAFTQVITYNITHAHAFLGHMHDMRQWHIKVCILVNRYKNFVSQSYIPFTILHPYFFVKIIYLFYFYLQEPMYYTVLLLKQKRIFSPYRKSLQKIILYWQCGESKIQAFLKLFTTLTFTNFWNTILFNHTPKNFSNCKFALIIITFFFRLHGIASIWECSLLDHCIGAACIK